MSDRDPSSSASTTDWGTLSERGAAILRTIALPISLGYSEREVAHELGISKRSLCDLRDELRAELERST